jgi:hypothetical protein
MGALAETRRDLRSFPDKIFFNYPLPHEERRDRSQSTGAYSSGLTNKL